ncbi:MAG TPA: GntR family transcriptional regulator, partial [Stenomitos sp.]
MKVFINRKSATPIHDQLCAQIGQLVASGTLGPGERLPSIRGLALRLGIHHNTVQAVYKTLAARGLLDIKEGSGVRVVDHGRAPDGWREGLALRAMAAYFVAQARAQGHDDAAILEACRDALGASATRVVVVNPHPDLQRLYLHELGRQLDLPLAAMTLEEVVATPSGARAACCFLTSTNHAASLQEVLGPSQAPVIFRLASTDGLFARIRTLGPDAMVGVVSSSPRFRFLTRELISGVLEESMVIDADLEGDERLTSALRLSGLIVTDSLGDEAVRRATSVPVHRYNLLSDET